MASRNLKRTKSLDSRLTTDAPCATITEGRRVSHGKAVGLSVENQLPTTTRTGPGPQQAKKTQLPQVSFPALATKILGDDIRLKNRAHATVGQWHHKTDRSRIGEPTLAMRQMNATKQLFTTVRELQALVRFKGAAYKRASAHRLSPEPEARFCVCWVEHMIQDLLHDNLQHYRYDGATAGGMTLALARVLHAELKTRTFPRYRFVSTLTMGQRPSLSLVLASRCLWSSSSDTFASVTYENPTFFVTVLVFGVYKD